MSGNRERMRDIFDQARRLPAPERAAFLDGLVAADGAMRTQIEDMLAALEAAGPFLSEPTLGHQDDSPTADSAAGATLATPLREGPGTRIGPYKLLQLIGEGGFGSVFMAEQEWPVARKVALKIIKLGMDTRTVVARFEQERQALAMMDHPNIAKVLDAGATDTGRPYFVMELCKGEPIAEYCDKHNLSIPERLELFAQVCQAVQHAHGKGIIHRDLKPSNVLVSTQDGRAHAKVIDFGIAKATASKLTEKTLFTEHKALVGTPEYMSPEQAEGSLDIDTRTDVYSLGVILYELLTGTTPFTGKELRSGAYAEIQRIIREVEPVTPSTRLSANTQSLATVAANRRTEPRKLGVLVKGDLDWIVMKALEKDRSRRYETAQGLAMDIRRFLSGEPVLAAPPGAGYRINKFVRRHRVTVTAGAAVSASLLIGAVGFALKAREAGLERDAAITARQAEATERAKADGLARSEAVQRAAAESEQRKAAAINQFLLDMLRSADLSRKGRDARVADTLDTAAATVGTSFAERPEVEAAVRQILGRT
jgi:serine/threonine protein kinase